MSVIIGIVGRCGLSQLNRNGIEVLEDYRIATIKSGGTPILILPPQVIEYNSVLPRNTMPLTDFEKNIIDNQLSLCDGVIMPGGTRMYEYDKYICEYCNNHNIPLLGICMGMQVMCNYNNNNRNLQIEDKSHYSLELYKHTVQISKDSRLFDILKQREIKVNSYHNYKVANSGSYNISAVCEDVIEAVEGNGTFNIGLQWHPERIYDEDINSQKIFGAFTDASKEYKKNRR